MSPTFGFSRQPCAWAWTLGLATVLSLAACSTAPDLELADEKATEPASLAEAIEGVGVQLEHSQYFIGYTRSAGVDAARFRVKLLDHLQVVDRSALFGLVEPLGPPLRARDFWALVLANETGEELEIHSYDSFLERDRLIDEFLLALSRSDSVAQALRAAVHGSTLDLSAYSDGDIFAGAMRLLNEPDAFGSRSPAKALRIHWQHDARTEVVAYPASVHELCRIALRELLFPVTHVELRQGLLTPQVLREAWRVSSSPFDEQASQLEAALWGGQSGRLRGRRVAAEAEEPQTGRPESLARGAR